MRAIDRCILSPVCDTSDAYIEMTPPAWLSVVSAWRAEDRGSPSPHPLSCDTSDAYIVMARPPRLSTVSAWSLLVGCLTSQQHASVSQGRICSDNFTCCHTEIEAADQTFYLTQSQYTDTGPTSPSTDPIMPGAWQGCHWSANFEVTGMTRSGKIPSQVGFEHRIFLSRGGRLYNSANEVISAWRAEDLGLLSNCWIL